MNKVLLIISLLSLPTFANAGSVFSATRDAEYNYGVQANSAKKEVWDHNFGTNYSSNSSSKKSGSQKSSGESKSSSNTSSKKSDK